MLLVAERNIFVNDTEACVASENHYHLLPERACGGRQIPPPVPLPCDKFAMRAEHRAAEEDWQLLCFYKGRTELVD